MIPFTIIRSARRTVAIVVNRQGEVSVRVPNRISAGDIQAIITERQDWIRTRVLEQQKTQSPARRLEHGATFLYLGVEYPLEVTDSLESGVTFDNGFRMSRHRLGRAKKLFEEWYKHKALATVKERIGVYASHMGVRVESIRVSSAQGRWGSCSKNNINISWRLIMAPPRVLDYVVIHELAHIPYKNHSKKFWDLVAHYEPQHKDMRKWLRKKGSHLNL